MCYINIPPESVSKRGVVSSEVACWAVNGWVPGSSLQGLMLDSFFIQHHNAPHFYLRQELLSGIVVSGKK